MQRMSDRIDNGTMSPALLETLVHHDLWLRLGETLEEYDRRGCEVCLWFFPEYSPRLRATARETIDAPAIAEYDDSLAPLIVV